MTKFCKLHEVSQTSMLTLMYLMEGKWLLSTNRCLSYDIICNEFEKDQIVTSKTVNAGVSVI